MKRWIRNIRYGFCVLVLLIWMCPLAQAEDEVSFYDCILFLGGYDSQNQLVCSSAAVQVQAGDGSGNTWAVTQYSMVSGASTYIAIDPLDSSNNSYAQLIASDADSGIAVFRLDNRIQSRTCPALRTLDGLTIGDSVMVAGFGSNAESNILFSRAAVLTGLETQGGYSFIRLEDGRYPLSEITIATAAAIMTSSEEVVGFYVADYRGLPSGYIMANADGIGSLEDGTQGESPQPSQEDPPAENPSGSSDQGSFTLETIESDTGMEGVLRQAEATRNRETILRIAIIAGTVVVAGGLIGFALLRTRRQRGGYTSSHSASDPTPSPVQPMGKTEYIGSQEYGKTEPVVRYCVVPLDGTPGEPREIPAKGLTFGRSPECDVTFDPNTSGVSGKHCSILFRDGAVYLTDLGSSFGTLLEDGRKLSGETVEITDGAVFYLGSRNIAFQLQEQ